MRTFSYPAEYLEELPLVTAEQASAISERMLGVNNQTRYQMMECAGLAVSRIALQYTSEIYPRIAILVGKGDTAGCALVAAKNLARRGGRLQVILTESPQNLREAPKVQLEILQGLYQETPVHDLSELTADTLPEMPECDLIIDGLLGMGIRGVPREPLATLISTANNAAVPTISVDLPSGLHPDSGLPALPTILAAATVCLGIPKTGLTQNRAQSFLGEVYLADIGLCPEVIESVLQDLSFPRKLPPILHLYTKRREHFTLSGL
mgnify:CR=1 FL=1